MTVSGACPPGRPADRRAERLDYGQEFAARGDGLLRLIQFIRLAGTIGAECLHAILGVAGHVFDEFAAGIVDLPAISGRRFGER